jgi:bacillithiol biosynthesis cysteine-adding enzyme BshC
MDCQRIAFRDTRAFTPFFLDYIDRHPALTQYYSAYPELSAFGGVIAAKKSAYTAASRKTLVQDLEQQYSSLKVPAPVQRHLDLLAKVTTFTVTTGHQLNLFTGPLYVIYKIVTVINTCRALKKAYPGYDFVPVYWMASEDHDFDEIDHFRLFGKTYRWPSGQTGAVGRMSTLGMSAWLENLPGDTRVFKEAYAKGKTLAEAARLYMTALFGNEGLVVIDADRHELKKALIPVAEDDLFVHSAKKNVDETSRHLKQAGYETHVHAREINFFYLAQGRRERIERGDAGFALVDSNETVSEGSLRKLLTDEPEVFSPNVILRPLYQELILPNLAYVGGPAEVVYWLQLKSTFDHFRVPFPVIMPRNFGLVADAPNQRKWKKTGLGWAEIFLDKPTLLNAYTRKNGRHRLELGVEKKTIQQQFAGIRKEAASLDATLSALVDAEQARAFKSLEKIEHKLLRAEKRALGDKLRQVEAVKDALFPGGSLQERTDNLLNFYPQDPHFIKDLIDVFDPFDFRMHLLLPTA